MKKLTLLFAFVVIALGTSAQTSLIKASPGGLAFGNFNACYETALNEKSSVLFSASAFFGIGDLDGTALGAGVNYRMYFNKAKAAPNGFYVGPGIGASFGDGANALSINVPLGYQWIWDSGFVLDIGAGPQYYIGLGDDVVSDFDGILPTIILAIGYAF